MKTQEQYFSTLKEKSPEPQTMNISSCLEVEGDEKGTRYSICIKSVKGHPAANDKSHK